MKENLTFRSDAANRIRALAPSPEQVIAFIENKTTDLAHAVNLGIENLQEIERSLDLQLASRTITPERHQEIRAHLQARIVEQSE